MSYLLYGIPNCDTVKKVRALLDKKKVSYEFINFKKQPPTKTLLQRWKKDLGDLPVNTKGPTFRKIKQDFENASASEKIQLLIENSSAIKRPILEKNSKVKALGFEEEKLKKLL